MSENEIREPIQKRSIEKKERIIKYGFNLICKKGYYNTNTVQIAKEAGVSTGIVYSYFNDKHDILLEGLKRYADDIFYPSINFTNHIEINEKNLNEIIKKTITKFVENHKLSQRSHEEITAMAHSDKEVAELFHRHEIKMTDVLVEILEKNGFSNINLREKVHVIIGLIDNLCHEIVYHKHDSLDYNVMTDIVIDEIVYMLTKKE